MSAASGLPNDLPYFLFAGLLFDQRNGGSKFDGVARKFCDIDYFGPRELILKLGMCASLRLAQSWQPGIQNFPPSWCRQRLPPESVE